ncbi:MAG TPA: hypothetical protein VEQ85_13605, partial [Lacipirellulaceae bacterium]|nr:hypothetical protein [Lacipirellulaceae bacterium]
MNRIYCLALVCFYPWLAGRLALAAPLRPVALSGEAAPGAKVTFSQFHETSLNEAGRVAFVASVVPVPAGVYVHR